MSTELRADGELTFIAGASRTGKTLLAVERSRKQPRLLVWDVELQWPGLAGCHAARSRGELVRLARDRRVHRIAYQSPPPPIDEEGKKTKDWLQLEFNFFCSVAWVWLQREPGTIVSEELSDVTSPGKAPAQWGQLVRRGLKYGANLIAITQRPAESDKTAIGNASRIISFRMSRAADEKYISLELRCDQARVAALKPLHFLERDTRTGEVIAGTVKLPKRRASNGH